MKHPRKLNLKPSTTASVKLAPSKTPKVDPDRMAAALGAEARAKGCEKIPEAAVKHPDTASLTWIAPPNPSSCGCIWRRCEEFGDVVVEQCAEHQSDPLDVTFTDLTILAREVAFNRSAFDDPRLAEMCMRHGPAMVQKLDEYFEAQVSRFRYGQERHS